MANKLRVFCGRFIFITRMNILSISAAKKPTKYDSFSPENLTTVILRSVTLVFTVCLEPALISLAGEIEGPNPQFQT